MTTAYQKPPEPASAENVRSSSPMEMRKRYSTEIKELSMQLTNEVRLVQSSIWGLQGVTEGQVWAQVQQAHVTLHTLEAALGVEEP
jgi:hypothetical protein